MRIGVMGGTFDPIHHGHLVAADEARDVLGLDRVVFVPAGNPWQKVETGVTPAMSRYEMVCAAVADNDAFVVSRVDIDRPGPTYTVDTLRDLRREFPEGDLYFITGADAMLEILTWKDPQDVVQLARFVAVTRPGYDATKIAALGLDERVITLEIPALAVSSTDIRQRVAAGRTIRYLVPRAVRSYIGGHALYRT